MIHFACPRCGNTRTKILATQWQSKSTEDFKRKRSCHQCGNTFVTYEVAAKEWKLLKGFIKLLERHK